MSSFDLFNEFRPLFLLLDQPSAPARSNSRGFNSHFGQFAGPAVEFAEEEAELPGVKKEDLKVIIDEGGSALTIAGSRV
jgi:HSP20 family molecular chaperone IbpA